MNKPSHRMIALFGAAALAALSMACEEGVDTLISDIEQAPTFETAPTVQPASTVERAPTFTQAPTAGRAPTFETAPTIEQADIFASENTVTTDEADPNVEAPAETTQAPKPTRDFEIVTLLAPDAIPAINNPRFFETTEEADSVYQETELVLGIEIDGDARAYSVPLLSEHEIVNDVVAGNPVAITW